MSNNKYVLANWGKLESEVVGILRLDSVVVKSGVWLQRATHILATVRNYPVFDNEFDARASVEASKSMYSESVSIIEFNAEEWKAALAIQAWGNAEGRALDGRVPCLWSMLFGKMIKVNMDCGATSIGFMDWFYGQVSKIVADGNVMDVEDIGYIDHLFKAIHSLSEVTGEIDGETYGFVDYSSYLFQLRLRLEKKIKKANVY